MSATNLFECFAMIWGSLLLVHCYFQVLNINIPYKIRPRREGDPAILVSDINKASKVLGWKPDNSEIKNIIETAYNFEKVKDSIIEASNGTDK